jgi:hypothetical protein
VPYYKHKEPEEPRVARPTYVGAADADDEAPTRLVAPATQPEPMAPLDVSSLALAQIERAAGDLAMAIERGDIRADDIFERRVRAVADQLLSLTTKRKVALNWGAITATTIASKG